MYHLAIVGAGAAGLTLLYEYLQKAENIDSKILLLDSGDRSKKSWCFWAENNQESFPFLIEKSWSKITYRSTRATPKTEELADLNYHYISSGHFFDFFFHQFIPEHTQIKHVSGLVDHLLETDSEVEITMQNGEIWYANQVADSRLQKVEDSDKAKLSQHFWGKFVEFDEDILDSSAVTLMDFSQAQTNNAYSIFHYILPFTARKALIETTVFSKQAYQEEEFEAQWNRYMSTNFAGKNYQVTDIERGTIPMKMASSRKETTKIFPIGTAAGQVKASTGYAFTRMHRDAKARVNQSSLVRKDRFTFYDSILLHMIETENKVIPMVMDRLFGRFNFTKILLFLDEKTTLWEEINLFSRLQIPLFIKHLVVRERHVS
jgi:lycopene beta-cyclase